jgi:hypothetical protein
MLTLQSDNRGEHLFDLISLGQAVIVLNKKEMSR